MRICFTYRCRITCTIFHYLFKYSINISLQMFFLLLCEGKLLSASNLIKFLKSNKDIQFIFFSLLLAKITQCLEFIVLFS